MRSRRALSWMAVLLYIGLTSCSYTPNAVLRNATGGDIVLWPLSAQPLPLKSGETTKPFLFRDHNLEAFIERGNCLYTYPPPDYRAFPYAAVPEKLRKYDPKVVVVIHKDMSLHVHDRSKKGVEGPEIMTPVFPLKPTTFCGRHSQG